MIATLSDSLSQSEAFSPNAFAHNLHIINYFFLSISLMTLSDAMLPINVPETDAAKLAQPHRLTSNKRIIILLSI